VEEEVVEAVILVTVFNSKGENITFYRFIAYGYRLPGPFLLLAVLVEFSKHGLNLSLHVQKLPDFTSPISVRIVRYYYPIILEDS
jgi:hypothetical protein